jgi:hypothetical protein
MSVLSRSPPTDPCPFFIATVAAIADVPGTHAHSGPYARVEREATRGLDEWPQTLGFPRSKW